MKITDVKICLIKGARYNLTLLKLSADKGIIGFGEAANWPVSPMAVVYNVLIIAAHNPHAPLSRNCPNCCLWPVCGIGIRPSDTHLQRNPFCLGACRTYASRLDFCPFSTEASILLASVEPPSFAFAALHQEKIIKNRLKVLKFDRLLEKLLPAFADTADKLTYLRINSIYLGTVITHPLDIQNGSSGLSRQAGLVVDLDGKETEKNSGIHRLPKGKFYV